MSRQLRQIIQTISAMILRQWPSTKSNLYNNAMDGTQNTAITNQKAMGASSKGLE